MNDGSSRSPESRVRLFVYGTLMRDGRFHAPLAAQPFLGRARSRPLYALFDLGAYPALTHEEAEGHAIEGEVYEVPGPLLDLLDRIEGAPRLFRLELIELEGDAAPVYAYFYQREPNGHPLLRDGRWDNRRGQAS
jgi:gamma-glutamylcyclotransferase (GGCT)/AIG2-like uncharacterized protein YtfP